ncbi:MAG: single-stranded-DNA-specific exonuclease RecJ [Oscillospiraceae bacterium]|nr:single-stranded-DNA-specific exonuclease RecJ [Oscillospiraceae bacterium]
MRFTHWKIRGFDRRDAIELVNAGIPNIPACILASRGVTDTEEALSFASDDIKKCYSPFALRDMDKAVAAILGAIKQGEKIAVFGDYDVDGITASALMYDALVELGAENAVIYIPSREDEGYGLNSPAIDWLTDEGVTFVITVDCGITGAAEIAYLYGKGMRAVVTDHHNLPALELVPVCEAVINPKRPDCEYPNKDLAGVGVAFKLAQALLASKAGVPVRAVLDRFADLVAMGTIADVMSVVGENRILIRSGLRKLREEPRPGIAALIAACNLAQDMLNTAAIGFTLAPRINAAGRMGQPMVACRLMLAKNLSEGEELAGTLIQLNNQRREIEQVVFDEVNRGLEDKPPRGPIILSSKSWHQGVSGIVAAKTAEKYLFPTIILCDEENGVSKGSCRSFGNFRMFRGLSQCEDLLINYGGHDMAAGVTIKTENIPIFRERLSEIYHNEIHIPPEPTLLADFIVDKPEKMLTIKNIADISEIEPFGPGNIPPLLVMKDAELIVCQAIGGGLHTRLVLGAGGTRFNAIFFGIAPEAIGVGAGEKCDLAFEPMINEFRGTRSVQLRLFDVRPAGLGETENA